MSSYAFASFFIGVDVEKSARAVPVALLPAAQGLGNGLGPFLAAGVLSLSFGYNGVFIMCASASILAMLVYLYMYLRLRKNIPALADAS